MTKKIKNLKTFHFFFFLHWPYCICIGRISSPEISFPVLKTNSWCDYLLVWNILLTEACLRCHTEKSRASGGICLQLLGRLSKEKHSGIKYEGEQGMVEVNRAFLFPPTPELSALTYYRQTSDAVGWHHVNFWLFLWEKGKQRASVWLKKNPTKPKPIKWNTSLITWWYFIELFWKGNCCM